MIRYFKFAFQKVDIFRAVILALAFFFLFFFLDWKPAQHDEGVNGWFIEEILQQGYYAYDPANYHGPLFHYLMFFFKFLMGSNLWALRMPAVLFAMASFGVMLLFRPYLGKWTAYAGTLFAAVSPGMIFYSRYGIHESSLLFFSLLALLGFFRFMHLRDRRSLWLLGLGMTGMIVTKETFLIATGCFALAWTALRFYEKHSPSAEVPELPARDYTARDVLKVCSVCALIYVTLYSGFFLNWKGVAGIFSCFAEWFKTGVSDFSEQKGHWKPFIYWAQLFLRYEWPACLGLLFCFPLLAPVPRWHRLMMFYAVANFLAYSLISYKTPWCILQILWPFFFVAAAGLREFIRKGPAHRGIGIVFLTGLPLLSAAKCISLNFIHYADDREWYPHVQTFEELKAIDERLKRLAARDPNYKHMPIHVVMKSYWPISWLLADFTQDFYYIKNLPLKADGALIFCDVERQKRLEMRLKKSYYVGSFRLNPAQKETILYYDRDIFKEFFDERAVVFVPKVMETLRPGEGLIARYYASESWEGPPVMEEVAATVNYAWDGKDRPLPPPFGIVFEGQIMIPESGEITFYLASDDGSDLTIAGETWIDNLGRHPEEIKSAKKFLEKGTYPIRVRHNDIGGGASIRLWWQRPGRQEEAIEPAYFQMPAREEDS